MCVKLVIYWNQTGYFTKIKNLKNLKLMLGIAKIFRLAVPQPSLYTNQAMPASYIESN